MTAVDLVALLAVCQYFAFSALVGQARTRHGVAAPAVTGHPLFERAYRVQMNTLELLVALLPAMYLAAKYWPATWAAGAGLLYLAGRFVYRHAYLRDPKSRALGFALSAAPIIALLLAGLAGALASLR